MVKIVEEDWELLIILDACRYDALELALEESSLEGELSKKESLGTATEDWRLSNFTNPEECEDIVYISGNPQMSKYKFDRDIGEVPFKHLVEVWKTDWNRKLRCVRPEPVTERAVETINEVTRDYRFIVHYLQPHSPYLKEDRTHIGRGLVWSYLESLQEEKIPAEEVKALGGTVFNYVGKAFPREKIVSGYLSNLNLVLNEVENLLEETEIENIVLTADHSEMLGKAEEGYRFGHEEDSDCEKLREIPWLRIKK